MGDLLMLSFRGRPFRHAEAVPGTALTIAILIAISRNVKCLMSYIRLERRGIGNRGCKGESTESAFAREIRLLAWEPCRTRHSGKFRLSSAGTETIRGKLPDRDFRSSSDVRQTLPGLNFVM
ncbi:hypothetical protein [Burkholderia ubonensis]|uniref:hypothetical protein n=1 Tax=Burkholderia ubonensis TaxID=101571 RepID=UPI0018E04F38|nr:hypothetical protein [Burkholderia ubonensis]